MVLPIALALSTNAVRALDQPTEANQPEAPPTYANTPVPDDYDPNQAAHPLRIVAYALHPVGVALDWIIVRPAFWVVRHEPFRTIFGYED